MSSQTPQRRPRPEETAAAIDAYAALVLAQRLVSAQALRDGRRPVNGALHDTRAMDAEQEDAYTN